MKKKFITVALAATLVLGSLTGCSSSKTEESSTTTETNTAETSTATAASGDVVQIGVVSPNTGGYALYGTAAQNAVKMAVDEINAAGGVLGGKQLKVSEFLDDQGDATQAVNCYNKLSGQNIVAVVGSFSSSCSIPMAELAAKDNMTMITPTATNAKVTQVGPTIFRACFIDPYQGKMAAKFAKEKGWTKAAVIYAKDDDYSNGLKDAFVESAKAEGIEIVATEECTTKDTDYTAQASKVVASGADFVYYPCFLDTVPLLVQQVREAGFEGAIAGGDGWDGSNTEGLETYFENTYYSNHYSSEDTAPAVQTFVKKYTDLYGAESLNAIAACYYDAIYMLKQAIDEAGVADTAKITEKLTGMTFSGVTGTFTLDENRNPEKNIVFNTYKDGKVSWVETMTPDGK